MPYFYKQYNISYYWRSAQGEGDNSMAHITNRLIDACHENKTLPRLIIILPDGDILNKIAYFDFGASRIIGDCLTWMVNQISAIIEDRKAKMKLIREGSTVGTEPKLVWVKMMSKPTSDPIQALKQKYNEILEETLASQKLNYILEIDGLKKDDFDHTGNLLVQGMATYWHSLDEQIRKFDKQLDNISLKPRKVISLARQINDHNFSVTSSSRSVNSRFHIDNRRRSHHSNHYY